MSETVTLRELPTEMTDHVVWDAEFDPECLRYAAQLGFMAIAGKQGLQIVGFHADLQDRGEISPAITLEQRGEAYRAFGHNAKGVGVIMGNSRQSIHRPTGEGRERQVSVWMTPSLLPESIADLHHSRLMRYPALAITARRQLVRSQLANREGVQAAMERYDADYGDSHAAVIDPAPTFVLGQLAGLVKRPVPPVWAVYRHRDRAPLQRIGRVLEQSHR